MAHSLRGKLEETISTSFVKSANLRAFLLKEGCPPAIKNCARHFSKLIDPQVHNTLLTDIARFLSLEEEADDPVSLTGRMTTIAEGPYKALQSHFQGTQGTPLRAKVLTFYTLNYLTFSTFIRHKGNSFILVRHPLLPSIPAQIDSILQISTEETYFVVRFFLKSMLEDPFEKYPVLQSSVWSQELGQLVIVKPQDVESHFAGLSFKWHGASCLAVMSLSQVFFLVSYPELTLTYLTGILMFNLVSALRGQNTSRVLIKQNKTRSQVFLDRVVPPPP